METERFSSKVLDLDGEIVEIKKNKFLVNSILLELKEEIKEKQNLDPEYLGELYESGNKIGLEMLDKIAKISQSKVYVNEEAEWMFLCGKDVFLDSVSKVIANGTAIKKSEFKLTKEIKKYATVHNKHGDCLGYGEIVNRGKIFLNNKLDKGNYLRREMRKK